MTKNTYFLYTALVSFILLPHISEAQAAGQLTRVTGGDTQHSSTARAAAAKQPIGITAQKTPETINVSRNRQPALASGQMSYHTDPRAISTVSRSYIEKQAGAQSVMQMIQNAPGVNFGASDPFGVTNHSLLTMRGLNQQEIAFTVDGTPQNDINSGQVFASQLLDTENLAEAHVSQGSSAIDTPVFSDLGGEVAYKSIDPTDKMGGYAEAMFGTWMSRKQFIRLNTGYIGNTGIKGWVSFSNFHDQHWTGPGTDNRKHIDLKFTKEWGDGNRVAAVFSWADQELSQYYEPTLAQWNAKGTSNYYNPTFVKGASASYNKNYWQLNHNPWDDINVGLPISLKLNKQWHFNAEPYLWHGWGGTIAGQTLPSGYAYYGSEKVTGMSALPNTVDGSAVVGERSTDTPWRVGFNTKWTYKTGINELIFGNWYEYGDFSYWSDFTAVGSNGLAAATWGNEYAIRMPNGKPLRAMDYNVVEQTNGLYLADTVSLLNDKLKISAGLKAMMVDRRGTDKMPNTQYVVSGNSFQPLPRVSIHYQINSHHQIYVNGTTGFRPPLSMSFFDIYNPNTGAATQLGGGKTKDEYSIEEELGYRYRDKTFTASVVFFNYNFTNRQIASQTYIGSSPVSTFINVGGQTSRGVDVEFGTRPFYHFSPYVSFEYLYTRLGDNFKVGDNYLPTKGKEAVASPRFQGSVGISYDDSHFFGNFALKYIGTQYSTFMNDQQMPSQVHADMSIGYRFPSYGRLQKPTLQVNFINLGDNHYLSGIGGVMASAKSHENVGNTAVVGATGTPTYFMGAGFTVAVQMGIHF
ncbi:TonB-dependent receptor [Novacetimonas hansenii]|uniref:TonB-dependent receptor n=2 Tax=Novacetimonas hansenii TaxID=436 RepID=UPI00094F75DD|nr:TonB-dependent receptor [Novacetimonas hansenii]